MTNHNQGKQQKYIEFNGQMLRLKRCTRCNMPVYKYGSQRYEVINNNMVKHSINRCLEAQQQIREITNTKISYHRVWNDD